MSDYEVDYSQLDGLSAECLEDCGMCCLCQPEILAEELPWFEKNLPGIIVTSDAGDHHKAIALKKGKGACVLLGADRRCKAYDHRTAYCRQYPFHIYVSDRVEVEPDFSCRGLWTGKGQPAKAQAEEIVRLADKRIKAVLPQSRSVYSEFVSTAAEAGVFADPDFLRRSTYDRLEDFTEPGFLLSVLNAADSEDIMDIGDVTKSDEFDRDILREIAGEIAMDSLSSKDPLALPVYCGEDMSWNVFSADRGRVTWFSVSDEGDFDRMGQISVKDVAPEPIEPEGKSLLKKYLGLLNRRDSFMGAVCHSVDAYGYEDSMANAYYGSLSAAALDVMWRSALLNVFFGTGFGEKGVREGIMFYDMDRLDAPTIGAFV